MKISNYGLWIEASKHMTLVIIGKPFSKSAYEEAMALKTADWLYIVYNGDDIVQISRIANRNNTLTYEKLESFIYEAKLTGGKIEV